LEAQGFGFLLLARGRESATIESGAEEKGIADAREAGRGANREGFAAGSIVFLDVEEGGRLPPQFHSYLRAWTDELVRLGFRPGVYCSGAPVNDGNGHKIVTADDIRTNKRVARYSLLGVQRYVSAVSWMYDIGGFAGASKEWSRVRTCVAVCAITAAERNRFCLYWLCERW
jgi:hypothetical protein